MKFKSNFNEIERNLTQSEQTLREIVSYEWNVSCSRVGRVNKTED